MSGGPDDVSVHPCHGDHASRRISPEPPFELGAGHCPLAPCLAEEAEIGLAVGGLVRPGLEVHLVDVPRAALNQRRACLPALRAAGSATEHVVTFHPESTTRLLSELSSRGHRIGWDLVMTLSEAGVDPAPDVAVEQLAPGDELWERVAASFELFGVDPGEPVDQLRAIETDVLVPGGKRWFGVRDDAGTVVSLAALVLLEDVGYVDNVATFPDARGRGYASAVTRAVVDAATRAGVEGVFLLADPDEPAVVRMYERLGFEGAGRLASTRGPITA